ncbi:MAG: serine/threonine protein kinase [Labilithrix sp.]|nr:serine/threonine protein kinase [Labilithrix sp.]
MSASDDQLESVEVSLELGEVLQGKYRVDRRVGSGGMAAVFAGRHLELDQSIAIKVLLPEHAATPAAVRRFLSEARAAARLDSPHVARVIDVGTTETKRGSVVPFIVMELLQGRDLEGLLGERGAFPIEEAVEYVLQACSGVGEAHAAGIIHRDLKPANLFLTVRRDGSPIIKLLDFGISKNVARSTSKKNEHAITADRELMGSPGYMSPEQVRSSKDVDPRTDVWSLGVILYELVTGVHPFLRETIADTFVEILQSPPRPLTEAHVPPGLVAVIGTCLEKKADARYASVDALAAALAPFRGATPLLVPELAQVEDGAPSTDAGVSVRTLHELPKRRALLTVMLSFGAVGLVLIAVAGLIKLRASREVQESPTPTSAAIAPPPAPESAAAAAPLAPTSSALEEEEMIELPETASTPSGKTPRSKAIKPKPPSSATPRHRTNW